MSRAWIAFYMGDYDKDTSDLTTIEHGAYFLLLKVCWTHGSIPLEPARRAAIAKMSPREWNKIAPRINSFFNEDGTQKRATKEIAKAEETRLRKAVAGHLGGKSSGFTRALKAAQLKQERSRLEADVQARGQPAAKLSEPTLNSTTITSSLSEAAREGPGNGNAGKVRDLTPSPYLVAALSRKQG